MVDECTAVAGAQTGRPSVVVRHAKPFCRGVSFMQKVDYIPSLTAVDRVSYAQNMEDILLDRLFRGETGTYLDIGANHPLVDNNSYFFYSRGWRGLNLEPSPALQRLFLQERPEDLSLAVAASDADGERPFYEVVDCGGLSTMSAEIAAEHAARGHEVREQRVAVRSVASLVEQYQIDPPEFVSIDVEGHEIEVLRGLPLERWQPKVLVVESTLPMTNTSCHEAWEPLLLAHGYLFATFNGVNRFYLRADLRDRLERLAWPVNVLDGYERFESVQLRCQVNELSELLERVQATQHEEQTHFAMQRTGWEWALVSWEREREAVDNEREHWVESFENWKRKWVETELAHRADHASTLAHIRSLEAQLKAYRLLDPLGLMGKSYGLARRIKRKLTAHRAEALPPPSNLRPSVATAEPATTLSGSSM